MIINLRAVFHQFNSVFRVSYLDSTFLNANLFSSAVNLIKAPGQILCFQSTCDQSKISLMKCDFHYDRWDNLIFLRAEFQTGMVIGGVWYVSGHVLNFPHPPRTNYRMAIAANLQLVQLELHTAQNYKRQKNRIRTWPQKIRNISSVRWLSELLKQDLSILIWAKFCISLSFYLSPVLIFTWYIQFSRILEYFVELKPLSVQLDS